MSRQSQLEAIEILIHQGATPGERAAARAAYQRVAGHPYEVVEQMRSQQARSKTTTYRQAKADYQKRPEAERQTKPPKSKPSVSPDGPAPTFVDVEPPPYEETYPEREYRGFDSEAEYWEHAAYDTGDWDY